MSQESSASTIPYEISQGQDDIFIEDLNLVYILYFQNRPPSIISDVLELNENVPASDSDEDINYESDCSETELSVQNETDGVSVPIENSLFDLKEQEKQNKFKILTCGCSSFHNKPCSDVIDFQKAISFRQYCQELTRDELDLVIKAHLITHRQQGPLTNALKHKRKERERNRQQFHFHDVRICRQTFCFLHDIDKEKLSSISKSLDLDGLTPRVHGLKGKQPANSLSYSDKEHIKEFLCKYASDNALPLPGRLPNFRKFGVLLLPSDKCMTDIHGLYQKTATESGLRNVSLSTFTHLWHELCPHIVLSKPMTDLCQKCQQFTNKLLCSGSMDEEEKSVLLAAYNEHVSLAKLERDFYRQQCIDSKHVCSENTTFEGVFLFENCIKIKNIMHTNNNTGGMYIIKTEALH